jgi:hypothetical protein
MNFQSGAGAQPTHPAVRGGGGGVLSEIEVPADHLISFSAEVNNAYVYI